MRNSRLVCRYALILAAASVLSFAASDWSLGALGVTLDLPVASIALGHDGPDGSSIFDHLTGGFGGPYKVPEPSTTVLFGIGMAGAYLYRRRSK